MVKSQIHRISVLVRQSQAGRASLLHHVRASQQCASHAFHTSSRRQIIKQYPLADIGEGTTECQIIQWRVQVGARVNEFDPLCEVASDKATTDIPSRYSGVIKKLYYEADEYAIVGQPLVDIDVDEGTASEIEKLQQESTSTAEGAQAESAETGNAASSRPEVQAEISASQMPTSKSNGAILATPATRHLTKQLGIDIADVVGSGKDGRIMKDDVQRFTSERNAAQPTKTSGERNKEDTTVRLSGMQAQMFKTMTKSLSIPHFLYTDAVDMSRLTLLRQQLQRTTNTDYDLKLSPLPFIIKAVSMAMLEYPALNAHLDPSNSTPVLTLKAAHNFGIAVDTPQGLVVPVIRNVDTLSILEIAAALRHLAATARAGKLTSSDLTGATFTISNIGSIGGGAVAPVIVAPQVAILGVGRAREVLAFAPGAEGARGREIVSRQEAVFSWSADHRVCDGAMVARAGDRVRELLEHVERMAVQLR